MNKRHERKGKSKNHNIWFIQIQRKCNTIRGCALKFLNESNIEGNSDSDSVCLRCFAKELNEWLSYCMQNALNSIGNTLSTGLEENMS